MVKAHKRHGIWKLCNCLKNELVRILYRVYVGREADEEGLAGWVSQLDAGVPLETVLDGFAASLEFAAVVNGLK